MHSLFLKVSVVHATLVSDVRSAQAFHKFVLTLSCYYLLLSLSRKPPLHDPYYLERHVHLMPLLMLAP